ncbi:MAG: MFS transporter [Saprospiraceae bacterium]
MLNHLSIFFKDPVAKAIGGVFAVAGILFGTWAALIPFVKNKFELDEAQLGILLLMLPLGVGLMNPVCVPMIRKLGPVKATLTSLIYLAIFLVIPINMPTIWLLGSMLFLYGMGYAAINITMNTCAAQLEQISNKSIMATCHGLWSGGAMIGSAAVGVAMSNGARPQLYVIGVGAFAIFMVWAVKKPLSLLPEIPVSSEPQTKASKAFIRPNRALWSLIIIGLCVNLGEGTMADWATVYVGEVMDTTISVASWGFATYAFFMMTGRLLGDGLINNFGSNVMLRSCGILLTTGYLIAVFAPNVAILFFGLALIGLGVSLGSPILYAASAKVPGLPQGVGLAIFNTYAVIAFLGGPVFIGFLAKVFSLPTAFLVVASFGFVWVIQAHLLAQGWRLNKTNK